MNRLFLHNFDVVPLPAKMMPIMPGNVLGLAAVSDEDAGRCLMLSIGKRAPGENERTGNMGEMLRDSIENAKTCLRTFLTDAT